MGFETFGVRTLVTFVFGPLILFSAWLGGWYFAGVVTLIALLAQYEFYGLAVKKGALPQTYPGLVLAAGVCLLLFAGYLSWVWLLLSGSFILLAVAELFRNKDGPILNVATTFMGLLYIAFPFGFLILIRQMSAGGGMVILIFLAIWICDSAAYIVGSKIGRRKLFPRVSPNKTVEGTAAGFLFALATAYFCYMTFLGAYGLVDVLVVGAICGSLGQVSDLLESLFKRDAQVKDSSHLIPGHGGVLDRFDSEILVAPAVYLFLQYFVAA